MELLIIDGCFGGHTYGNELAAFLGFVLIITTVVLAIRERIRKKKNPKKYSSKNADENYLLEKDVLGLDKTYVDYNEPGFKPANKSKLKYAAFIILFVLGLLLMLLSTSKRQGAYGGSVGRGVIHHPDDKNGWSYNLFNWFYSNDDVIKDTLFPPTFQEKDVFKNSNEKDIKKESE